MIIMSIDEFTNHIGNIDIKLLITACKTLNVRYSLAAADTFDDIEKQVLGVIYTHSDWNPFEIVVLYRPFDVGTDPLLTSGSGLLCVLFNIDTVESLIKVLSKVNNIKAFL